MVKAAYIHVPFCKRICSYCDFFRYGSSDDLQEKWLTQVLEDIQEKDFCSLKTIYIGGGTPSVLNASQLERLFACIMHKSPQLEECTMEANVESFDEEKISLCVKYGVNRISIGVQSMDDELLKTINRNHTVQDVIDKVRQMKEHGIKRISVDLIYALPNQTMAQWKDTLKKVVALDVSHISLYALTIEPNSIFGKNGVQKGDDELEADMYEYAITFLKKYGYLQYEIANFAKIGEESKHNLMYWHYEDFYGIGCGASGKEQHIRYDNEKDLLAYCNGKKTRDEIVLTKEDEMFEFIMMGLRLQEGICMKTFEERFHISFEQVYQKVIHSLLEKKWILIENGYLKTTKIGMWLLHEVLLEFME